MNRQPSLAPDGISTLVPTGAGQAVLPTDTVATTPPRSAPIGPARRTTRRGTPSVGQPVRAVTAALDAGGGARRARPDPPHTSGCGVRDAPSEKPAPAPIALLAPHVAARRRTALR